MNILWVSFEDTSPRFGCYGDRLAKTPNVDRVAAGGCVYERGFSTAGVCAPSRCSIITGAYATWVGGQHMRTGHTRVHAKHSVTPYEAVPPAFCKAFTERLRGAGWYCTNNDKLDYQFGAPTSAWDECSNRAHWRNRPKGSKFFAVFNLNLTHESGMWPAGVKSGGWRGGGDGPLVTDPGAVEVPPYLPDTREVRETIARQYDNIAANDARLGVLLGQLEEDGLADDTAVFIWSDHGEGLPRRKRWPYDSGTHVPLIVKAPGMKAGSRSKELVSMVDLGPTTLGLAGLEPSPWMHGRNFLGPRRDPEREYVFATRDRYDESYDKMRSVRDARYRYVANYYPELEREVWLPYRDLHPAMREIWRRAAAGTLTGAQKWFEPGPRPAEELYDTEADPHETVNLATDPARQSDLRRLRGALAAWQAKCDPYFDVPEAEMVRRWHAVSPDGTKPVTEVPLPVVLGTEEHAYTPTASGRTVRGPVLVQWNCQTEGASIEVWTAEWGRWKLYTGPIRVGRGEHTLKARAVRYGYVPSGEVEWTVRVE